RIVAAEPARIIQIDYGESEKPCRNAVPQVMVQDAVPEKKTIVAQSPNAFADPLVELKSEPAVSKGVEKQLVASDPLPLIPPPLPQVPAPVREEIASPPPPAKVAETPVPPPAVPPSTSPPPPPLPMPVEPAIERKPKDTKPAAVQITPKIPETPAPPSDVSP